MERLTARGKDGKAFYPKCFDKPCLGSGDKNCTFCDFSDKVCETLAEYEDLELTPDQMREIDRMYRELCEKLNKVQAGT